MTTASYATVGYNPGMEITPWQYPIRKHDPIDLKKTMEQRK